MKVNILGYLVIFDLFMLYKKLIEISSVKVFFLVQIFNIGVLQWVVELYMLLIIMEIENVMMGFIIN